MMEVLFSEKQKFSFWWLWLLLVIVTLFPAFGLYKQMIIGEPFGSKPMSNTGLVIMMMFMLLIIGLFLFMHLKTEITKQGISIRFFPFTQTMMKWSDIESSEILDYGFVGYGIRMSTKYGTVYNIKGSKGLAIKLKNGKKYCIGTQKQNEMKAVIDQLQIGS